MGDHLQSISYKELNGSIATPVTPSIGPSNRYRLKEQIANLSLIGLLRNLNSHFARLFYSPISYRLLIIADLRDSWVDAVVSINQTAYAEKLIRW